MKKRFLFLLLALSLATSAALAASAAPVVKETTLTVRRMICSSCATAVEKALRGTDGVQEVTIDTMNDKVRVKYDERKLTPQQLVEVVKKSGYQASWPAQ